MKNKKIFILIVLLLIILIVISFFIHLYIIDKNRMENGEEVMFSTWGNSNYITNTTSQSIAIEFQTVNRVYTVISNLNNMTDDSGEYNYYVIEQFQMDNPTVIRLNKKHGELKENTNYEFELYGAKELLEDTEDLSNIFNSCQILSIQETDKVGLDI